MTFFQFSLLTALLLVQGIAMAQPKVDVSFTTIGISEVHNKPAFRSDGIVLPGGITEAKSSLSGDETFPCNNNQIATRSSSTANATGSLVKKDDSSVSVALNAYAWAKGGKFERCARCDGQFCGQSSGPQQTEAKARSEVRANVAYQFDNSLSTKSLKSFRLVISILESSVDQTKVEFKLRRKGTPNVTVLIPDKAFDFTPRANDEIILDLSLKASVSTSDETATKEDQPRVKLRIDLVEAPVLEAAIQDGYILKGTVTKDYRSVGLIAMVTDNGVPSPHCTGTVVGKSTILTAAHCVSSDKVKALVDSKQLIFMMGSRLDDMIPVVVTSYSFPHGEEPDKFKFNMKFDKTMEDDIAILVTDRPMGLPTMNLYEGNPSLDTLVTSKTMMTFVGFGLDPQSQAETGAGIKRSASIPVVKADNATFLYNSLSTGSNTCHGDSGGPAFITDGGKLQLVGVTSYGSADCTQGRSMRVDRYISWIKSKIN